MMSAAGGERKGILNNPAFVAVLVVVAIIAIVVQWRSITGGGFPRLGRPAVAPQVSAGPAPEAPPTVEAGGVAAPEGDTEEAIPPGTRMSEVRGGTPTVTLQELTPPLRDPFAEEIVKIEPLMGRSFGEPEVVPPPKFAPPRDITLPPGAPPAAEAAIPVLPDFQVVMIVAIGRKLGAVIRRTTREENLVFPGDALGEETVSQIADDGVILSGEYGTRALRLSGFQFAEGAGASGSARSGPRGRAGG
jgi:hypothetical protein